MKRKVDIWIGEFYASAEPVVITTLLGSCVGVCLFDPAARVGGMNHILLPGAADLKNFNTPARFAVNAMELLINRIMALGGSRFRMVAKIFGGSHLFPSISIEKGPGAQNTRFVVEFLSKECIPIKSMDTGGRQPRKIMFHTDTGEVWLKRIHGGALKDIAVAQDKSLTVVRKKAQTAGDVTLFEPP